MFGKTCHELLQQVDWRRFLQVAQVAFMVPGLSTSSSSSLLTSTSMTLDHPTSSSSSSTSPTTTVSGDSETPEREGLSGIDSHPMSVSSEHVQRQERGDPYSSAASEEPLTKPTKNPTPNENEDPDQKKGDLCHSEIPKWLQEFWENLVDERVLERQFFAWTIFGAHAFEKSGFELTQCWYLLPERPKLRDLPEDQNPQRPRAGDAMVETYFVQNFLVTW